MKLHCPDNVGSINVAGTEYTAVGGVVTINDPSHIAAAEANGFTVVDEDTGVTAATEAPVAEFTGE